MSWAGLALLLGLLVWRLPPDARRLLLKELTWLALALGLLLWGAMAGGGCGSRSDWLTWVVWGPLRETLVFWVIVPWVGVTLRGRWGWGVAVGGGLFAVCHGGSQGWVWLWAFAGVQSLLVWLSGERRWGAAQGLLLHAAWNASLWGRVLGG